MSPTRRALLSGATGLAATLAGCGGLVDGSSGSTRTATAGERPAPDPASPGSGSTTDPETLLVRTGGDRPPVWLSDADDGRPTPRDHETFLDSTVVDGSRADRVAVADGVGRERVEAFLSATDFDGQSVYLETIQVEECFRLQLCDVSWTPSQVSTDYARQVRPYDERCAVDATVFEARLIRIADALDAEGVRSHSSSIGSGPCDRRRGGADGGSGAGVAVRTTDGGVLPTPTGAATDAGGDE